MFLHVGGDVVVNVGRVIAILNLRSGGGPGAPVQELVRQLQVGRVLTDLSGGQAKSLVLTEAELFLSPISSATLKKRAEQHHFSLPGTAS
ncbi:MAG TPA: extracellular matrix/biofilm biosynthesis regulator RemA family protein [Symbiobacteriaceae bacterium]|nr:extracellular matrix/biofilm biosynthesis regulator RemA family protein [Symbiobacteriaceae bacterium]